MGNFNKAFDTTMRHEGGYNYDSFDYGGETYRGISRNYHPGWTGWPIIDDAKNRGEDDLSKYLSGLYVLQMRVGDFYKDNFWDQFWGDQVLSQEIADELFDTAVNMGTHRAVLFLQTALNVLNRNTELWSDIVEDGVFGPKTLKVVNSAVVGIHVDPILKVMNILQGMHYINFMKKSPEQERFARGWLKRVNITKGND